jgi:hypothetical protein
MGKLTFNLKFLSIFILFIAALFSFNSCKKTDIAQTVPEINYEEKFFTIPEGTSPAVIRIINKIKMQNNQYHFVNSFVKKHGFPKWEYAQVQAGNSRVSARGLDDNSNDTLVLIPVASELEAKIKDVLACDVNAMDVVIKLIEDYTYKQYGYEPNPEGYASAKDIAAIFMKFEMKVYERKIFQIKDTELAKKILGDQWQNELTTLILKEDPITNEIGFYRTIYVSYVSTPTYTELPEVIITPAPGSHPIVFPIFPGVPIGGVGWWNGMDGGDPAGGGNNGTGGSGGSGGSDDSEEPGWRASVWRCLAG